MLAGSVFHAEQDWTGYKSDFLVYPVKKRVFFLKKHFEVALTPNYLTNDYKILGEEKNAFLVADTQLYKRLCPSVRRSVGPSVGPS